ncbi:hypothetical protein GJV85_04260 [Sulfurimonas aquatica]|uniref:DUF302 domain-containing protein n=2 Tax=Sulfurimonas aquatica TaxID=2672570 RepID=A0A975B2Q8_9BACT|nr:hypothetical protein GJV85_04260 [Sulfurimonas aquatica]
MIGFGLFSTNLLGAQGVRFTIVDGDVSQKYAKMISTSLEDTGFVLSDPHERINDAYAKRYGNPEDPDYDKDEWNVNLDNLGFYTIAHDEKLNKLLKVAPELGGFSPFNHLIYKNKSENKTYVGHLDPNTMLDIVGVKDSNVREEFVSLFDPLDKWITDELGGEVKTTTFDSLSAKPMMTYEFEFDRPEDITEFTATFQEEFEAAFEENKYIIAGFKDFKEGYEDLEMEFEEYDAYWVYSLCHFTFSYNMFNKGRPDTGVFAPCSMYMYIKEGTNKLVIGMPKLSNWIAVGSVKDRAKIEWTKKIDSEIMSIMKSLGAREI